MYELANTSLPNGLIAGTHGFATVAMTKGVPDALRTRLESYCAYNHRSNAHDESYLRENPINWFHAILPTGEHMVGRVAPSPFDYTGRTNRLARMLVFPTAEMPGMGAAAVLKLQQARLSAAWEGEAHYLDEDRTTVGQLRLQMPKPVASRAPAWDALISGGTETARRVAWQLERNLAAGGKSIYFKTSVAKDVSGEKLLALFDDLINLLPPEQRSQVAFSTYSAALPGTARCHLRGIYDADRFFEMVSTTQAWVDCDRGQVMNLEMLPAVPEPKVSGGIANQGSAPEVSGTTSAHPSGRPSLYKPGYGKPADARSATQSRPPWMTGLQNQSSRGKGWGLYAVMVLIAVVIICGGAGLYLMSQRDKPSNTGGTLATPSNPPSGEQNKAGADVGRLNGQAGTERQDESKQQTKPSQEKDQTAKAAKQAEAVRRKNVEDAAKASADEVKKQAQKEGKAKEQENARIAKAFLEAKEWKDGRPDPQVDKSFTTNDNCRVYFYNDQGVFVNEPAGFVTKKIIGEKSVRLQYGNLLANKAEQIPSHSYGFVIWYNPKTKIAWIDIDAKSILSSGFDWKAEVNFKPFFADGGTDRINIREMLFGRNENVFKAWEIAKSKFRYSVYCNCSRLKISGELLMKERELGVLSRKEVVKCIEDFIKADLQAKIDEQKRKLENNVERNDLESEKREAAGKARELKQKYDGYKKEKAKLRLPQKPEEKKEHLKSCKDIIQTIKEQIDKKVSTESDIERRIEYWEGRVKYYEERLQGFSTSVIKGKIKALENQQKTFGGADVAEYRFSIEVIK